MRLRRRLDEKPHSEREGKREEQAPHNPVEQETAEVGFLCSKTTVEELIAHIGCCQKQPWGNQEGDLLPGKQGSIPPISVGLYGSREGALSPSLVDGASLCTFQAVPSPHIPPDIFYG